MSTSNANRNEIIQLIREHETHTEAIFKPYGGVIVKNLGDSFMAIFDSATSAMRACLEIVESTVKIGSTELAIRASLATGDVEEIDGDYFGEAVNLSARINSKAPGGECWFANRTRLCMNQKEIPFESVGFFDFKGLPDTIECFRAVPPSQCVLPELVEKQAKLNLLKIITPTTESTHSYSRSDVLVLKGFTLDTPELDDIISNLPSHMPASQIYLLGTTLPPLARKSWTQRGYGLIIGTESAFDTKFAECTKLAPASASHTLFMDFGSAADVSINTIGFAVRKPINGLMDAYHYDFLQDQSWGFHNGQDGILQVSVGLNQTIIKPYVEGVSFNGVNIAVGETFLLEVQGNILTPVGVITVTAIRSRDYRWLLQSAPIQKQEGSMGDSIEFGREPGHPGYILKERSSNEGIVWAMGESAQMAKRNNYTLDRIIIGRQQAKVSIDSGSSYTISTLHKRIPTLILREDTLMMVSNPTHLGTGTPFVLGTRIIEVVSNSTTTLFS